MICNVFFGSAAYNSTLCENDATGGTSFRGTSGLAATTWRRARQVVRKQAHAALPWLTDNTGMLKSVWMQWNVGGHAALCSTTIHSKVDVLLCQTKKAWNLNVAWHEVV